jgi:hypothetical protein
MPQLVVTAVLVEGRSKSEVARDYGLSRGWVITLVQRYLAERDTGLHPRSGRPRSSPSRTTAVLEDEIVAIRKDLDRHGSSPGGLDHLADPHRPRLRHPAAAQTPQEQLRALPGRPANERWQADITPAGAAADNPGVREKSPR